MCPEMYVPEPTNIPIEKTNHHGETDLEAPLWPTPSENDIIHLPRDMGHLQVDYRENNRPHAGEDASLDSIASVVVPIIIGLSIIIAFLFINQKKQWIPLLCWYRTPTKATCHCRGAEIRSWKSAYAFRRAEWVPCTSRPLTLPQRLSHGF
uniref:Cysteine rich transmembrane BMP regulator 1 n=1 Tax=Suricata suricatta TaxID=37032 RepID=A0A673T5T8_SURSU